MAYMIKRSDGTVVGRKTRQGAINQASAYINHSVCDKADVFHIRQGNPPRLIYRAQLPAPPTLGDTNDTSSN